MKTLTEPLLPITWLEEQEPIALALNRRGYGYISFIPPSGLIEKVMRGWNEFLKLPLEVRMRWRLGDPKDYDDGYVSRCQGCEGCTLPYDGKMYDNKHFFHYRPHLFALLDHQRVDYSGQLSWLEDMHSLYEFCRDAFLKALCELDLDYPEFGFAERFSSHRARVRRVIRLLSYNEPMRPGQELGKAHVDRNFGTIQVYESHPALVLNLPEGKLNYAPRENQALMFTGAKAHALTNGRLRGINHAIVVPDDFVPQSTVVPRQSIVFFGHIFPETA